MLGILKQAQDVRMVPIDQIVVDPELQARLGVSWIVVQEYAEAMQQIDEARAEGEEADDFPPVVLFFDGELYRIGDGNHRVLAAPKAGRSEILAKVTDGTRRDALRMAVGANDSHGLRRSQGDKRKAVEIALKDRTWGQYSDREIARMCHVDHKTVGKMRADLEAAKEIKQAAERKGADGRTINTAQIGTNQPDRLPAPILANVLPAVRGWLEALGLGQASQIKTVAAALNTPSGGDRAALVGYLGEHLSTQPHDAVLGDALRQVLTDLTPATESAAPKPPLSVEEAQRVIYHAATTVAGREGVLVNALTRLEKIPWDRYKYAAGRPLDDSTIRAALPLVKARIMQETQPSQAKPKPAQGSGQAATVQAAYAGNGRSYAEQVATNGRTVYTQPAAETGDADPRQTLRTVVDAAQALVSDPELETLWGELDGMEFDEGRRGLWLWMVATIQAVSVALDE